MIVMRLRVWLSVILLAIAAPNAAAAAWLRAESAHFVVYGPIHEADLREYVATLEDFDGLLRQMHGVDSKALTRKLDVYMVVDTGELRRVMPRAADGIAGFYSADQGDISAFAMRRTVVRNENDKVRSTSTAFHEYVHHFMMQYDDATYPPWLIEGMAEYYATAELEPKTITIGLANRGRVATLTKPGSWIGIEKVLKNRHSALPRAEWLAFYAQSWLLTHYVMSTPDRRAKLKVYLKEWREDGDSVKAWKTAFGEDPKGLTESLRQYQLQPLSAMEVSRAPTARASVAITRMSPAADAILLETQQIKRGVPTAGQAAMLEKARSVYKRLPNDPIARIAAARAETSFGDRAAGEAILNQMIADDPTDWEAMLVLAGSLIRAGQKNEAERKSLLAAAAKVLGPAAKLRPDDYRVYVLYAQTRSEQPGEPSENTLNVLAKAVQLAPQVDSLRITAATAYMKAEAYDEVRYLLEPVANNPHGGGLTTRAQTMLAELDKKNAPASAPAKK